MIKTFLKDELAISLWVGVNGGYITTDEYIDMMQLQNLSDGSEFDIPLNLDLTFENVDLSNIDEDSFNFYYFENESEELFAGTPKPTGHTPSVAATTSPFK